VVGVTSSEDFLVNSAFYPQRDGKWVPSKGRWSSAAEK